MAASAFYGGTITSLGGAFAAIGTAATGGFWGGVLAGAVGGFIAGGVNAALGGGDLGDIFKGAFIGGIQGAASAGIGHGSWLSAGTLGPSGSAIAQTAAHGILGGAVNEAMGGKFQDGFLSAAAAKGATFMPGLGKFLDPNSGQGNILSRTALAATIGGTASALGGGKFANGAKTAAMQHLFNEEIGYIAKAMAAANRLKGWRGGTIPTVDYHGPGTPFSDGLKYSNGAEYMREYYYSSGKNSINNFDYNWGNSLLGIWRIFRAGFDGAEQFVGSWQNGSVERSKNGKMLLFTIEAPTSNESFYRPATSLLGLTMPRNVTVGPQRNIMAIIWWTEPYNSAPYRPAIESQQAPLHIISMGY
jgi:hypothetical protein